MTRHGIIRLAANILFPAEVFRPFIRMARHFGSKMTKNRLFTGRFRAGSLVVAAAALAAPGWAQPPAPPPAPATPPATMHAGGVPSGDTPQAPPAAAKAQELRLETHDGVDLRAWHYPATLAKDAAPAATVILLHDIEGSHRSVEPLALSLQAAGCDVVAPDLRGHGDSTKKLGELLDVRMLKKADFELMAASRGGKARVQAALRGDVEAVRNWIKSRAEEGKLDADRLVVVGSGMGAAVAVAWAAEDASWPPLTRGPQGQEVRGLVLISPTWTTRGFTIGVALGNTVVKQGIPLMVIAGRDDRDADKVFEQLKRQRPDAWFQQRADRSTDKASKLEDPARATLFFFEFNSNRSRDALAGDRSLNPGTVIAKFFGMALDRPRP